ncbi:hypothetical protein S1OALGB6SA_1752 [Olavius algarvensis spirochete endosymbiont]|nr:MAG: hypothetical protein [Olavius algarvensis spirochete endosymbiont]VDB00668.1 hypothetical protein S1OALGB6SA_1752 [Olavius algarvensis spirochete endosymbiont]
MRTIPSGRDTGIRDGVTWEYNFQVVTAQHQVAGYASSKPTSTAIQNRCNRFRD